MAVLQSGHILLQSVGLQNSGTPQPTPQQDKGSLACMITSLPGLWYLLSPCWYVDMLHTQRYIHTRILGSLMKDASPVMNGFTKPVKISAILCSKEKLILYVVNMFNVSC